MATRRGILGHLANMIGASLLGSVDRRSTPTISSVNWAFDPHNPDTYTVTIYGKLSRDTRYYADIVATIDTGEEKLTRVTQIGDNQDMYSITFLIEETCNVYEDTIEIEYIRVNDE